MGELTRVVLDGGTLELTAVTGSECFINFWADWLLPGGSGFNSVWSGDAGMVEL